MKLRVLFIDIETAPLLAHAWRLFKENISLDQLLEDTFLLCWSAKWMDEPTVFNDRLKKKELRDQNDDRIVLSLADLVRSADVVVAHNGDKFDLTTLNFRVAVHGQEPLGPWESIDTLKLAKQNFRAPSYKLDYLAYKFLGERKIKTDFEWWRDIYWGDTERLAEMQEYCDRDVELLERVFHKMRPYVRRLKRLYDPESQWQFLCTNCGGEGIENFMRRGEYRTQASTFQKWQCKTKDCGKYYRERISKSNKRGRLYPL